jgi:hypothetical protein
VLVWVFRSALIICILASSNAWAAAWTLAKGSYQAIPSMEFSRYSGYSYANDFFLLPRSGTKLDISTALEYGLSDSLTLGITPHYQHITDHFITDNRSSAVFNELLLRKRFWQQGNRVLSVQPMVKLAASDNFIPVTTMDKAASEVELRILGGQSIFYHNNYHFVNAELAVRQRLTDKITELHSDNTLGIRPYKDWLILSQLFSTVALGNYYYSHSLFATEISAVTPLNDIFSLQFGVTRQWSPGNSLVGNGIILAVWIQL